MVPVGGARRATGGREVPRVEQQRGIAERALREGVERLVARGMHEAAAGYSADACFAEYVAGGAGRWSWFVPVLIALGLPAPMNQFFHDQLAAFLHDHIADPADAPMPRV